MSGAPLVYLEAPPLRCGAALCECGSYAEAASCEHARRPVERAHLVRLLREVVNLCAIGDIDEHSDDGIGWAAFVRETKRALARE